MSKINLGLESLDTDLNVKEMTLGEIRVNLDEAEKAFGVHVSLGDYIQACERMEEYGGDRLRKNVEEGIRKVLKDSFTDMGIEDNPMAKLVAVALIETINNAPGPF